jgi:hypothetical protein
MAVDQSLHPILGHLGVHSPEDVVPSPTGRHLGSDKVLKAV